MSYADIDLEMVPAAPPTLKNQRATSCPAPISANAPSERVEADLERFWVGAPSGTFVGNRSLDSVCHGPCTTFLTNYGGLLLRWTGRSFPSVLLLRRIPKSQLAELLWFGCRGAAFKNWRAAATDYSAGPDAPKGSTHCS